MNDATASVLAHMALEEMRRDSKIVELVEGLSAIKDDCWRDPEYGHIRADQLLLTFIGDDRVTDAFDAVRKWYA